MYAQTSLSNKSALAKRWPNGALHFVSDGTSMSIAVDEPTEDKIDVADAAILEVCLALKKGLRGARKKTGTRYAPTPMRR